MHMRNKGIYKKCAHKNCLNHLARQWDVNRTRRLGARQGNYSRVFLRLVDAPRLLRLFSRDIHTTNLLVAAVRLDASAYKQCKVRNTRNRTTQVSQRSPLFTGGDFLQSRTTDNKERPFKDSDPHQHDRKHQNSHLERECPLQGSLNLGIFIVVVVARSVVPVASVRLSVVAVERLNLEAGIRGADDVAEPEDQVQADVRTRVDSTILADREGDELGYLPNKGQNGLFVFVQYILLVFMVVLFSPLSHFYRNRLGGWGVETPKDLPAG